MSIAIDQKQCIGCGKCRMICPGSLIHQNEAGKSFIKYPKDCTGHSFKQEVHPQQSLGYLINALPASFW